MRFFLLKLAAISCLSTFLNIGQIYGQDLRKTTFGSGYGIPPTSITNIAQDSLGYLWIGSKNGLHKFDGKSLKSNHSLRNNEGLLPRGEIAHIEISNNGNVFVAIVGYGLYSDDGNKGKFAKIEIENYKDLALDRHIDFHFKSLDSIYIFNVKGELFRINVEDQIASKVAVIDNLQQIIVGRSKDELILAGSGLFTFDLRSESATKLDDRLYFEAVLDEQNTIWGINTLESTLFSYNLLKGKADEFFYPIDEHVVYSKIIAHNEEIWLGTWNGISVFNSLNTTWDKKFAAEPINEQNRDFGIFDLYKDRNEVIWFSQGNGLHAIDPQNQNVENVRQSSKYTYNSSTQIDDEHTLLADFNSTDLHLLNMHTNLITVIPGHSENPNIESPFEVIKIENKIWIFYLNGIAIYDLESQKFSIPSLGKFDDYFSEFHKKEARFDGKYIWLRAFRKLDLWRIDPQTLEVDSMDFDKKAVDNFTSRIILQNSSHHLFFDGLELAKINFEEKSLKSLELVNTKINFGYLEDVLIQNDEIWMINDGQLHRGSIARNQYKLERKFNIGQSVDDCYSISSDSIGNIFVISASGLSYYIREEDRFIEIGGEEGLQNLGTTTTTAIFAPYILIYNHGIQKMRISDLDELQSTSTTHITEIRVAKKVVPQEDLTDLSYKQNDLSFRFQNVDLTKALDVEYRYRIKQGDDWIYTDYNNNIVYYTDLSPGQYQFQVASKGKFSNWSEAAELEFTIRPPFWLTWRFILASLLLLGGLSYLFYSRRTQEIRRISEMKTKMAELENEALRAQMNPHFIFNSLNSIKAFIINNDRNAAADYLTDFSELIRTILGNSRETEITLRKELEALQLYIDIENIRLENKFTYNLHLDSHDPLNGIMLPPLTLQPFVENSIWHGLVHKMGKGQLDIYIKREGKKLVIDIRDDGVGRARSKQIETKHKRRRSFGILITKQRLENALPLQDQGNKSIVISDLYDENENAIGTNVRIHLPIGANDYLSDKPKT